MLESGLLQDYILHHLTLRLVSRRSVEPRHLSAGIPWLQGWCFQIGKRHNRLVKLLTRKPPLRTHK